jgi:hypothetical protein
MTIVRATFPRNTAAARARAGDDSGGRGDVDLVTERCVLGRGFVDDLSGRTVAHPPVTVSDQADPAVAVTGDDLITDAESIVRPRRASSAPRSIGGTA